MPDRRAGNKEGCDVRKDEVERQQLFDEYAEWYWRPRTQGGEFDFGDQGNLRRGI